MTFLNPIVLLGLAAAGIPLIIHLFNFRRPQRIDFSSLAFVKELQQTTMRRVRIKQWLLLLMRTLALAALVLAFARPTLTGGLAAGLTGIVGGDAAAAIGIVLDNSRSMDVRDTRGSVFAQSVEAANAIVRQADDDDTFILLTTAGPASRLPISFSGKQGAIDFLAGAAPADGAEFMVESSLRMAAALGESPLLNKELYVVGDGQSTTFAGETQLADSGAGRAASAAVPTDLIARFVKLNDRSAPNVGITNVTVESRIVELGQPVVITADIANYGPNAVQNYVASVLLNDQRVAQATVNLPANDGVTARFTATAPARGWLPGLVRGEADDFESDDQRHFTLHVPQERSLLLVRGVGESVEYLSLALSPTLAREGVFFRTKTIDEQDLPAESIYAYDAVVLVGLESISSGEVSTLSQYVEQGGGLLVFPGSRSNFADYDRLLQAIGGGRITGTVGALGGRTSTASLANVELEHPLFDGVFDEESLRRGRNVEQLSVFFAAAYAASRGTEQTLIELSSGTPFMQEMRHGAGATLLVTVAPDPSWSEFPLRGLFVPLLYRSVFYLSAGEQSGGEQLTVGRPAEIRLSGVARAQQISLRSPGGETFTPERRDLFGGVLLQVGEQIGDAGVYDVLEQSANSAGPSSVGAEVLRRVAFNLSAAESDLSLLEAREAAERLEGALGVPVSAITGSDSNAEELGDALQAARTGTELWNVFLVLALSFLAVEMLIEKHWRPEATS